MQRPRALVSDDIPVLPEVGHLTHPQRQQQLEEPPEAGIEEAADGWEVQDGEGEEDANCWQYSTRFAAPATMEVRPGFTSILVNVVRACRQPCPSAWRP